MKYCDWRISRVYDVCRLTYDPLKSSQSLGEHCKLSSHQTLFMHFELEITSGCKFAGCIFMGRIIAVCWWGGASRPSRLWTGHRGGVKVCCPRLPCFCVRGWSVSPGVARRLAVATTVDEPRAASRRCHLCLSALLQLFVVVIACTCLVQKLPRAGGGGRVQ